MEIYEVGDKVKCFSRTARRMEVWTVVRRWARTDGFRYDIERPGLLKVNVHGSRLSLASIDPDRPKG